MAGATVRTKHPNKGKSGRNISKEKYEAIRKAMLSALRQKALTHSELFKELEKKVKKTFEGNVSWYGETVKLDLEARKAIERTATRPERYRIKR